VAELKFGRILRYIIEARVQGIAACSQGARTRFVTSCSLANELIEARTDKRLGRMIQLYTRYGLLIIDELGYVPFSKEWVELLFQVLADRHERKSVIMTSNHGFGNWTQIFGDPTLTAALLDRITHKAHIVNCSWESYHLKDTLRKAQLKDTAKAWERRAPSVPLPLQHRGVNFRLSQGVNLQLTFRSGHPTLTVDEPFLATVC
jgi:hypothetical protein